MTRARSLFAISLACVSVAGYACDYPSLVEIPEQANEGRATERLREATQVYVQAMQVYTQCIQAELQALGDNATPLQRSMLVTRNNYAVAEVEAVLDLYAQRVEPVSALSGPAEN